MRAYKYCPGNKSTVLQCLQNPAVNDFEDGLKVAGKKHDVIGMKVYDKMDMQLPAIGLVQVQDLETGKHRWLDTNDKMVQYNYQQH